jgi:hypothetical protein
MKISKKIPVNWKKFAHRFGAMPISNILLAIWMVFSVLYIGYDLWQEIKSLPVTQAYQSGKVDTLNALVASSQTCKPVAVQADMGAAQLLNVACLQQKEEPSEEE